MVVSSLRQTSSGNFLSSRGDSGSSRNRKYTPLHGRQMFVFANGPPLGSRACLSSRACLLSRRTGDPPLSPVFSFLPLFFLFASSARLVILSSHEEPDRGDRAWEPRVRPIIRSINPLPTFAAGRCTRCLANRNFRGIVFACARARAGKISLASNDKDDRFPALGNGRDSGVLGNFFSLFLFPRT